MPQNLDGKKSNKNCPWGNCPWGSGRLHVCRLQSGKRMHACWFLNSSFLSYLLREAKLTCIQFHFICWLNFFRNMEGLYISCPFNENFREWKLFMNFNLGEGDGGNFTPCWFSPNNSEMVKDLILQSVAAH